MEGRHIGWLAILTLCVELALCALPARAQVAPAQQAQQSSVEPAGYTELIDQALEERNAGHFEEAHALFMRAHEMFPNARTLRALGMVEFDLRDYRASAEYLEQALASQVRPLAGAMHDSVTELLARAQGYLGKISLSVEPSEASVQLDGVPVTLSADQPVLVNFGEHTFDVSAPGFVRETRKVNVRAGQAQSLHIALAADPNAAPVAAAPAGASEPASAPDSASRGPGALPWVLVGISGALMVGGGVLIGLAQGDIADVEDAKRGSYWSDVSGAYDAAPVKSGIGIALLGVGAAGLVSSLIWALGSSHEERAHASSMHLALLPTGAALDGEF